MRASAHEWFQDLQRQYALKVKIQLVTASDIEHDLLSRRSILEKFFPGLQLDPSQIKALVADLDQLTTPQVADAVEENWDQLKRRLEEKDARFSYGLRCPPDSVTRSASEPAERTPERGLIMSVFDNNKIIDLYARDSEALALDPPKFRMRIQESDMTKIEVALKRGTHEELGPVEVLQLPPVVAELLPSDSMLDWKVIVGPTLPTNASVLLRTTFGSPPGDVVYQAIEYRIKRLGTEEVEIESIDSHLPFFLSIVLRLHGSFTIKLRSSCEGKDVRAVYKWFEALNVIEAGGRLELYDIKQEGRLALGSFPPSPSAILSRPQDIVRDLMELSDRYGVPIRVPRKFDQEDADNLRFALEAARSGRVVQENVARISFNLKPDEAVTPEKFATFGLETSCSLVFPQGGLHLRIGDNEIDLGPYTMYCPRTVLAELDQTRKAFFSAKPDGVVRMVLEPRGPVELFFHRFSHQPAGQPPP